MPSGSSTSWGAVILSSGAVGNSTTILASGGYHIYKGAVAYTTMVTSGAQLGIGFGGTVYNLKIETGANATFYDGSILRGWSDFAGTVTVNAGLDAAGSMINFDITERSTADGVIISNVAGITGTSYFVTVDATQSAGRYYLAGNAAGIASLTITGTSNVLTTNGAGVALNGNTYNLGLDAGNNLYLDIAKTAGSVDDWDAMDLGTWDEVESSAAATLTDGAEEKKGDGFLAIA